jgi:hypothetical protein
MDNPEVYSIHYIYIQTSGCIEYLPKSAFADEKNGDEVNNLACPDRRVP